MTSIGLAQLWNHPWCSSRYPETTAAGARISIMSEKALA
jgi:hypothetical protein